MKARTTLRQRWLAWAVSMLVVPVAIAALGLSARFWWLPFALGAVSMLWVMHGGGPDQLDEHQRWLFIKLKKSKRVLLHGEERRFVMFRASLETYAYHLELGGHDFFLYDDRTRSVEFKRWKAVCDNRVETKSGAGITAQEALDCLMWKLEDGPLVSRPFPRGAFGYDALRKVQY